MLLVYLLHLASGACIPVVVDVYDVYSTLELVRVRAQGQSLVLHLDNCAHHMCSAIMAAGLLTQCSAVTF